MGYLSCLYRIKERNELVCYRHYKMEKSFTSYYGLLFNCPVDDGLESCGFKRIRQFNLKDRLIYYDALTMNEKKTLIEKHQRCLSVREKKTLFHESQ